MFQINACRFFSQCRRFSLYRCPRTNYPTEGYHCIVTRVPITPLKVIIVSLPAYHLLHWRLSLYRCLRTNYPIEGYHCIVACIPITPIEVYHCIVTGVPITPIEGYHCIVTGVPIIPLKVIIVTLPADHLSDWRLKHIFWNIGNIYFQNYYNWIENKQIQLIRHKVVGPESQCFLGNLYNLKSKKTYVCITSYFNTEIRTERTQQ